MAEPASRLPQFPLELVVFPGEKLSLHIFELRYRNLVADCIEQSLPFGISPVIEGKLMTIGTQMEIIKIHKEYPDGRLDIVTIAQNPFEIISFQEKTEETTYGMADVSALELTGVLEPTKQAQIVALIQDMFAMMQIPKKNIMDSNSDPYELGHKIGLTLAEEYALLRILDTEERQSFILEKLQRLLPRVKEMDRIRKQIEMNGHFRHLKPPKF